MDADVQKVVDKAVRDALDVPDTMATNFMHTKFPDEAPPLTFLVDNNKNSEKWSMDGFNEHQLDYSKALEDANNRLGIEKGRVHRRLGESYIGG